ncbi:hypothetical protein LTR95_009517 [Oleoguttula sp. CCFEE 5521]
MRNLDGQHPKYIAVTVGPRGSDSRPTREHSSVPIIQYVIMAKRKDQHSEESLVSAALKKSKRQHSDSDIPSAQQLVVDLNAQDAETFQSNFIPLASLSYTPRSPIDGPSYHVSFKESADLEPSELNACFDLIATTSRADYEPSSFGWHPSRKRSEMIEDDMRYFLVRRQDASPTIEKQGKTRIDTSIEGFLSFQICHDSVPLVTVLYIYEIHLSASLRGLGMGAHLMQLAEDIAAKVQVEKVMLTVFVSNSKALGFYRSRGYVVDACSPGDRRTRNKIVRMDHFIMSKIVKREAGESKEPEANE